jgi:predicted permease
MLYLTRLALRLKALFQRDQLDHQLEDELAFHLAEQKAELLATGLSEAEAERQARLLFGPVTSTAEQCRDTRRTQWLEDFATDTRYAIRSLRLSPSFALAAILTLALGIGANTAFFATAYGILFRPLPYPYPDRLIEIDEGVAGVGPITTIRSLAKAADYAGYLASIQVNLFENGDAARLEASIATSNLLSVLDVSPARGRWFNLGEEQAGKHRVAVLSHRLWQDRFNSDPNILGRKILLDEKPYEVLGVMPQSFTFPTPGTDLWLPIAIDPRNVGYMWGGGNLFAIGRLKPGATINSAQAEIKPIINRTRDLFPWRMPDAYGAGAIIVRHDELLGKQVRPKLLVLSIATLLLLLIACGNVGNLMLARSIQREREFAMREALGANHSRLLRQILTENLVLVTAGGLAGLLAASLIFEALPALLPKDTPRLSETMANPSILLGAFTSLLLTLGLFALAPLVKRKQRSSTLSLALIGAQLAIATTLLIGAGLMGRTLWQLAQIDTGLKSSGLVTASISAGPSRCPNRDTCNAFIASLNRKLLDLPGTQSVAWANMAPLEKGFSTVASRIEDHPRNPRDPAFVLWQTLATPAYFETLGIPLREGRLFNDSDTNALIIGQSTAKRFWPNASAIGKRIQPMSGDEWLTIVGVVGDVKHHSLEGYPSWVDGVTYRPLARALPNVAQTLQLSSMIRTSQPGNIQASITPMLQSTFPGLVVSSIATLDQLRSESTTSQRSTALLLALFAILGLALAIVGVHGVISHRAAQRTRELGIRLALGATPSNLLTLVLKETILVSLAGALTGVFAAYTLSQYLNSLLFGITVHDPLAFMLSPIALFLAATLAATWPALRVLHTDPALTLRHD